MKIMHVNKAIKTIHKVPHLCVYTHLNRELSAKTYESSNVSHKYDVVIVGGGIIGTATARELINRHPSLKFCLLEKENKLAAHQSGHNSGVLHTGIYYIPGSLKAKLCTEGINLAYDYCDKHNIPYKKCGKLIVAVEPSEIPLLENLYKRGIENGVPNLKLISGKEIKNIEPNCKGLKAILSPETGIVDWALVNKSFGKEFEKRGGHIHLNYKVKEFQLQDEKKYPLVISNGKNPISCKFAITCGGLHSDTLAELTGCDSLPKIVPFRGEYLLLKPEKTNLVRGNIYPVPNPKLPFLGVHFTPRINGEVWLGPNAVLAFKREGYNTFDVNISEMCENVKFRGLRKLALKHWKYGFSEIYRGFNINAQVKQLQRYIPSLQVKDVTRGPSGVRAQAMDENGSLVDDFVFDNGRGAISKRVIHLRNAPSPGATSSLAIAKVVADKFKQKFELKYG